MFMCVSLCSISGLCIFLATVAFYKYYGVKPLVTTKGSVDEDAATTEYNQKHLDVACGESQ